MRLLILLLACLFVTCAGSESPPTATAGNPSGGVGSVFQEGLASYYNDKLAGRKTASGAPYNPRKKTCAHRKLKFGTVVEVERKSNGKRVRCVVNDRGPFSKKKIIDLSRAAAEEIGLIRAGVAKVRLRKVGNP